MPCQDQTEMLELMVNDKDQLQTFRLQKISCGKTVGEETLLPYVQGKTIDEILQGTLQELVPDLEQQRHLEEFLLFKQFFSIRAALQVLVGQSSGQVNEPFVLEELTTDVVFTSVKGHIAVPLIHEEIRACGSCRSCQPMPPSLQTVANALIHA